MSEKELIFIQDQIGYNFQNTDLLEQAFTRKSYSQENGGENNEVMEFIGDRVLEMVVVKYLAENFGYYSSDCDEYDMQTDYNEFICEHDESQLTKIKQNLVSRSNLSRCIEMLDLENFLIMGKSDIRNNIQNQDSVKEDLFEAIVGAVALDSNWDFEELQDIVKTMLNESLDSLSEEVNYIEEIQEWNLRENGVVPLYHYEKQSYESTWYSPFNGISKLPKGYDQLSAKCCELKYTCQMKLGDELPIFRSFGKSKSDARKNVCEAVYDYLEENNLLFTIQDEIENPNKAEAINQLEILARRGYFSLPRYEFVEEHDSNGNPQWKCICKISEYSWTTKAKSSQKKEAKKRAAFSALKKILND